MTIRNPRSNYPRQEGYSLRMFTEEELRQVHYATLEVLWREGVHIGSQEAIDIFEDGGAEVDRSAGVVRIHPYMVEEAIRSAPSTLILAGRDPKHDVVLDGSRVNFTTFGAGVSIIDPFTGEYRTTTKADVAGTALVADYLDGVDVYSHAVVARDCPVSSVDLHEAEAFLTNTSKHCMHIDLTCGANAKKYLEMGAVIAGGWDELRKRPLISALICPQSPLQLSNESCEIIIEFARAGIPINILSMAMSGATSPITLAGTLVVHNAEVLTGIVLAQLVNKGAPVIYGSSTTTFDLQYATAPVGAPELGMFSAAVAAMAQFYLLPSYVAGA